MRCEWTSGEDLTAVRAAGPSGGYDLIIGADICYGQQSLPAVRPALSHLAGCLHGQAHTVLVHEYPCTGSGCSEKTHPRVVAQ